MEGTRKLQGKTALVTGASRGIGRGIALAFAREGADVAINFRRDADAARKTAEEIRALGRRAETYQADVADPVAMQRMFAAANETLGGFDVVVANSGVASRNAAVVDTAAALSEVRGSTCLCPTPSRPPPRCTPPSC